MSTMVCSKCGTALGVGAKVCPSCGQSVSAPRPAPAAPPKRTPLAAIAILGGGLVVLLAVVTLYRAGFLSGLLGTGAPVATPAATAAEAAPAPAAPATEASPAAVPAAAPAAPPAAAPTPATAATVPFATPPPAAPGTPVPVAAAPATHSKPAAPAAAVTPASGAKPAPAAAAPAAAPLASAPVAKPMEPPPPPPPPPPVDQTVECKESVAFDVSPDTAIVTVDGEVVGIANEWSGGVRHEKYKFDKPGVHYVKLSHRDYKTVWLKFVVSDKAEHKTAEVQVELKEEKEKK